MCELLNHVQRFKISKHQIKENIVLILIGFSGKERYIKNFLWAISIKLFPWILENERAIVLLLWQMDEWTQKGEDVADIGDNHQIYLQF